MLLSQVDPKFFQIFDTDCNEVLTLLYITLAMLFLFFFTLFWILASTVSVNKLILTHFISTYLAASQSVASYIMYSYTVCIPDCVFLSRLLDFYSTSSQSIPLVLPILVPMIHSTRFQLYIAQHLSYGHTPSL